MSNRMPMVYVTKSKVEAWLTPLQEFLQSHQNRDGSAYGRQLTEAAQKALGDMKWEIDFAVRYDKMDAEEPWQDLENIVPPSY